MSDFDERKADAAFDQRAYWIGRHERLRDDPRSVGNLGKGLKENLAAERIVQLWVGHAAQILRPSSSVIDIGCGYGRVAGAFCDQGYAYTGIDISPVAIEKARSLEPRGSFRVQSALDLTDVAAFDLASVLYVFVHFVNDQEWRALIGLLARALRPGGGLLFADDFPPETRISATHATHRSLSAYEEALSAEGMQLDLDFPERLRKAMGPSSGPALSVQLARKRP